jgi:hypothetical protein
MAVLVATRNNILKLDQKFNNKKAVPAYFLPMEFRLNIAPTRKFTMGR